VAGGLLQSVPRVNDGPFAYGILGERERMEGNGDAEAPRSYRSWRRVGKGLERKEIGEVEDVKERGRGVKLERGAVEAVVMQVFTGHDTKE